MRRKTATMDHALRDHKASHQIYGRAIIHAIDELQDFNLRSNIDSIRRHVQSTLGPGHTWNDVVFLKTLKALAQEGDVEQVTTANCALSPEFKRKRTKSCRAIIEKRSHKAHRRHSEGSTPFHHHDYLKEAPAKKTEHAKLKIIPKRIYDGLHVPIKHPMDTTTA